MFTIPTRTLFKPKSATGHGGIVHRRTVTTIKAAKLSKAVYKEAEPVEGYGHPIRTYKGFEKGGVQAAIYQNKKEVVVAIRGSHTLQDWTENNFRLAVNLMPLRWLQTREAMQWAKEFAALDGRPLIVTGHSLGGGLAQLASTLFDCTAVTFNGVPMRSLIDGSLKFDIGATPEQLEEARESTRIMNYRTKYDPVSWLVPGLFIGGNTILKSVKMKPLEAHSIEEMIDCVTKSDEAEEDHE